MHGIQHIEINTGSGVVRTVSTAVVGVVVTAPAAVAAAFPLNTPVVVTDLDQAATDLGVGGTGRATLEAIRSQIDPVMVFVRVAEGATDAETTDNVEAGVQKLAQAPQLTGIRPRIIGAPGLDVPSVRAEIAVACAKSRLDGFGYAAVIPGTIPERIADRNTVGARELMLIAGDFKDGADTLRATAVALGLRAKIDQEVGPQKSLSNVAVQGVDALSEPLSWALNADTATDVGLLNAASITALVAFNGFRFWGNRTAAGAADSEFVFEPIVRVGQMIRDLIGARVAAYVDKPLHPQLAKDLVEDINRELARASRPGGWLLGGTAWLDVTLNDANGLKSGKLAIDYDYTVPAPLELAQLRQRITDRYYADFTKQAAAA